MRDAEQRRECGTGERNNRWAVDPPCLRPVQPMEPAAPAADACRGDAGHVGAGRGSRDHCDERGQRSVSGRRDDLCTECWDLHLQRHRVRHERGRPDPGVGNHEHRGRGLSLSPGRHGQPLRHPRHDRVGRRRRRQHRRRSIHQSGPGPRERPGSLNRGLHGHPGVGLHRAQRLRRADEHHADALRLRPHRHQHPRHVERAGDNGGQRWCRLR